MLLFDTMDLIDIGSDPNIAVALAASATANTALKRCKDVDIADLERSISFLRDTLDERSRRDALRVEALDLLIIALLTRFNYDPESEAIGEILVLQADIFSLAQHGEDGDNTENIDLHSARKIIAGAQIFSDEKHLDAAISLCREAILLWPLDHPGRPSSLVCLADALNLRYHHAKRMPDLLESIGLLRKAREQQPKHVFRLLASLLLQCNTTTDLRIFIEVGLMYNTAKAADSEAITDWNSARAIEANFQISKDKSHLDLAIHLYKQSIGRLSFQHSQRPGILNRLATALARRYSIDHDEADLNEAIGKNQNVLELWSKRDHYRAHYLNCLCESLLHRFERLGDTNDIDAAIVACREAIEIIPPGHLNRLIAVDNLSECFSRRFARLALRSDIDNAIASAKEAADLTPTRHPLKPTRLLALGLRLSKRCEHTGNLDEITIALNLGNDAMKLVPDADTQKLELSTDLGTIVCRHFSLLARLPSALPDLDRSISDLQAVIEKTEPGHSGIPRAQGMVGAMFALRFEHLGNLQDVTRGIALLKDTVEKIPDEDSYKSDHLHELSRALSTRFQHCGDSTDIDQALIVLRSAIQKRLYKLPDDHPYFLDLGSAYALRFQYLHDPSDIHEAISVQKRVVAATQRGHLHEADRLHSLGASLLLRFVHMKSLSDAEEAVTTYESALKLVSDQDFRKPHILSNLVSSLEKRSDCREDAPDIEKWILLLRQAVGLAGNNKLAHIYLQNLGNLYFRRFQNLQKLRTSYPGTQFNLGHALARSFEHSGDQASLEKAIIELSGAARSNVGPPLFPYQAAKTWLEYTWRYDHSSVLDACDAVVHILPELAWLGLPLPGRYQELMRTGNMINAVAATYIECGDYIKAVEALKQGRSIVWSQLLQLRNPVDQLREVEPRLANRLAQVSNELETSGLGRTSSAAEAAERHRGLTSEWEDIVREIRGVSGFEEFLRPKKLKDLTATGGPGPIVILNISSFRCDALIITSPSSDVQHVPLPDFKYNDAQRLQSSLAELLGSHGRHIIDDRLFGDRESAPHSVVDSDERFISILAELWLHVVQPVLSALQLEPKKNDLLPRLWWCPTGPVTFLPIHAAGLYNTDQPGSKTSDFVVSSYITTLDTVFKNRPRGTLQPVKLLAIAQPSGRSPLPGTIEEIRRIESRAVKANITYLVDHQATIKEVQQGMKKSDWVHFACHGLQNRKSPTDSSLILADETHLKLSEIITMSIGRPQLAFMSACQTATGYEQLSEEAVHLAAGMLLAGYQGVVATMWSIMDRDAPDVAGDFYQYMFREQNVDHTKAAYALHHAVEKLRKRKGGRAFLSWVPFIHMGVNNLKSGMDSQNVTLLKAQNVHSAFLSICHTSKSLLKFLITLNPEKMAEMHSTRRDEEML
ncbi:CHAT domain-containing protein [Mycena rosella]|uniref:CHAT domain-containing protein n=1 Tax=Mycena rosella TaxID=1033263 RepID=A0AAD7FJ36_MYCRO|nr:CHAT domain-containing protein [Mycena rosella]